MTFECKVDGCERRGRVVEDVRSEVWFVEAHSSVDEHSHTCKLGVRGDTTYFALLPDVRSLQVTKAQLFCFSSSKIVDKLDLVHLTDETSESFA